MSARQRRARPLVRDTQSLRDDRLIIIGTDDTYAPSQYFSFFRLPRVQVVVVPADADSHAQQVLQKLKNYDREPDDELWMLLDTDHCIKPGHVKSFRSSLREAKKAGIRVALSRPCFEFWLCLHLAEGDDLENLNNAQKVEAHLRELLGGYDKTRLRREHFPVASVVAACKRARKLDQQLAVGDIPKTNTSRVYLVWESILDKALLSQLPAGLGPLAEVVKKGQK